MRPDRGNGRIQHDIIALFINVILVVETPIHELGLYGCRLIAAIRDLKNCVWPGRRDLDSNRRDGEISTPGRYRRQQVEKCPWQRQSRFNRSHRTVLFRLAWAEDESGVPDSRLRTRKLWLRQLYSCMWRHEHSGRRLSDHRRSP